MAEKRDYYEILGLQKGATEEEIKKAYRKKARENHPDLHPDDPSYVEKFQEVNEAHEVLSDPQKRARYDQFGHAGVDPSYGAGGGDPFGGMGGFAGSGIDDIRRRCNTFNCKCPQTRRRPSGIYCYKFHGRLQRH